jgi:hypothetical protein
MKEVEREPPEVEGKDKREKGKKEQLRPKAKG